MALIKNIETQYGIDANYWKVVDLNVNWLTKQSHISLLGWNSKTDRVEGKQSLASRVYDWSGEDFPFTIEALDAENENAVKIAYEKIKSLSTLDEENNVVEGEFADAQNDL